MALSEVSKTGTWPATGTAFRARRRNGRRAGRASAASALPWVLLVASGSMMIIA